MSNGFVFLGMGFQVFFFFACYGMKEREKERERASMQERKKDGNSREAV